MLPLNDQFGLRSKNFISPLNRRHVKGSRTAFLLQPAIELLNPLPGTNLGGPTRGRLKFTGIRNVILLIARSPAAKPDLRPLAFDPLNHIDQFNQAHGIAKTTAD